MSLLIVQANGRDGTHVPNVDICCGDSARPAKSSSSAVHLDASANHDIECVLFPEGLAHRLAVGFSDTVCALFGAFEPARLRDSGFHASSTRGVGLWAHGPGGDGPFHFPLSYLDFICSTEPMKQHDTERREWTNPPQPGAGPGEQRPQHFQDEDEADAFSRWLAHVEAGRIGPT